MKKYIVLSLFIFEIMYLVDILSTFLVIIQYFKNNVLSSHLNIGPTSVIYNKSIGLTIHVRKMSIVPEVLNNFLFRWFLTPPST